MKTLKRIISKYMYRITAISVIFILLIVLFVYLIAEQRQTYEHSIQTFELIKNRLNENEKELKKVQEEYKQTCLYNAEMIADSIEHNSAILNNPKELKRLAGLLEIDEIHIFDTTGRIFTGTHPEYYNYTFDSGDQMAFFKPMLKDKKLRLVQDITPNTAEGKLMQYSAVWSKNGEYIVQVGMEPVNIKRVTEKNEISYIFSLFKVNAEAELYDIDAKNGTILGSTNTKSIGNNIEKIGISFNKIENDPNGFHANVNGQVCFCVFQKAGDTYLGRVVNVKNLYQRVPISMLILVICLIFIAFVLAHGVTKHMNHYVVNEIHEINNKLNLIANGNFDENIEIHSSIELSNLSDYINSMLKSILDKNVKISYVLNKTNLLIGVYEYNTAMSRVQFTEYIPEIFSLNTEEMEVLSSDTLKFKNFIENIQSKAIPDEPNIFMVGEKFVRLEETKTETDVFGVVLDVTADIVKRRELETERDLDLLTGLFNRRGLDTKLTELFADPEALGYYALIMIDADGLKTVNDTYGHESGDKYIKKIADIINDWGNENSIASRQGGDEFVLFLYNYDSKEELIKSIESLVRMRNNSTAHIRKHVRVPLSFSLGYSLAKGMTDYQEMIKEADEKMYRDKKERQQNRE